MKFAESVLVKQQQQRYQPTKNAMMNHFSHEKMSASVYVQYG